MDKLTHIAQRRRCDAGTNVSAPPVRLRRATPARRPLSSHPPHAARVLRAAVAPRSRAAALRQSDGGPVLTPLAATPVRMLAAAYFNRPTSHLASVLRPGVARRGRADAPRQSDGVPVCSRIAATAAQWLAGRGVFKLAYCSVYVLLSCINPAHALICMVYHHCVYTVTVPILTPAMRPGIARRSRADGPRHSDGVPACSLHQDRSDSGPHPGHYVFA